MTPATYYPEQPGTETQDFEESIESKRAKAERRLQIRMIDFYSEIRAEDFAQLTPQGTKTEYKGKPMAKPNAKKAHKTSAVFLAVEDFVDFKAAMRKHDYDTAKPLYFRLRRMLGR